VTTLDDLCDRALALPGTHLDHPWGDRVVKVGKKIFVFLGHDGDDAKPGEEPGISVKLAESHALALAVPGATPTGYGLGKAGWVSVPVRDGGPDVDELADWVEESYRLVAPKKLVAELDAERPG
jgi:predicted DNA-binding protein (MmcQ/YjbR family)